MFFIRWPNKLRTDWNVLRFNVSFSDEQPNPKTQDRTQRLFVTHC